MLFSSALFPAHNALLHILRLRLTYLSGACSIAFRCVHPFTGKAVWSLWCGYCIVYCALPTIDPAYRIHCVPHCRNSVTLPEWGMSHTRSQHTIYAPLPLLSVSVYPAQVVHPDMFHKLNIYRHIAFAQPAGIHIYCSSFYLFLATAMRHIWYAQPYSYLILLLYTPYMRCSL